MGQSCQSSCGVGERVQNADRLIGEDLSLVRALGLSGYDARKIALSYLKLQRWAKRYETSGQASAGLLCQFFRLDPNPFTDRCFRLMEKGQTEKVEFKHFLIFVWNCCSYDRVGLHLFAFSIYDTDGSGWLEFDEMVRVCEENYDLSGRYRGKVLHPQNIKNSPRFKRERLQKEIRSCANEDGRLGLQEFSDFVAKHHLVLFPAFKLQQRLRERVGGQHFWKRLSAERARQRRMSINVMREDHLRMFAALGPVPHPTVVDAQASAPPGAPANGELLDVGKIDVDMDAPH